ncbi:MAG: hypothetical protein KatS3mg101_0631 [Patescibacteria group bacterium]|nr:MAG: hypothetical protein KatS3mg101_0631 [Patescibacteria group bacterium]
MKNSTLMILFLLFLIIVLGGGLFLLSDRMPGGTAVNTSNITQESVSQPIVVKDRATTESVLLPKGWKSYSNTDLRFTINYPEKAFSFNGSCEQKVEGSKASYRPKTTEVPVGVYEDTDGIHIYFDYLYELGDPETLNGITYFGSCTKKTVNLAYLKENVSSWHIIAKPVTSKTALESFIKDKFGSGCSIDTMTASATNNKVYDVKIKGDGLDLGQTKCPINYIYVLKYVPDIGMAYTYNLGQAYTFAKTADGSQSYDQEMAESFAPIL